MGTSTCYTLSLVALTPLSVISPKTHRIGDNLDDITTEHHKELTVIRLHRIEDLQGRIKGRIWAPVLYAHAKIQFAQNIKRPVT